MVTGWNLSYPKGLLVVGKSDDAPAESGIHFSTDVSQFQKRASNDCWRKVPHFGRKLRTGPEEVEGSSRGGKFSNHATLWWNILF